MSAERGFEMARNGAQEFYDGNFGSGDPRLRDHFRGARKMVTFGKWLAKRRIILHHWQFMAAVALLSVMYHHREGGSGKTFLIRVIGDFLNEHGNDFELV